MLLKDRRARPSKKMSGREGMETQKPGKEDISCVGYFSGDRQLQLLGVPEQTEFN